MTHEEALALSPGDSVWVTHYEDYADPEFSCDRATVVHVDNDPPPGVTGYPNITVRFEGADYTNERRHWAVFNNELLALNDISESFDEYWDRAERFRVDLEERIKQATMAGLTKGGDHV